MSERPRTRRANAAETQPLPLDEPSRSGRRSYPDVVVREALHQVLVNNRTAREIAAELGIRSPDTIRQWIRKLRLTQLQQMPGRSSRGHPTAIDHTTAERIVHDWLAGMSEAELAATHDLSIAVVHGVLARRGRQLRAAPGWSLKPTGQKRIGGEPHVPAAPPPPEPIAESDPDTPA